MAYNSTGIVNIIDLEATCYADKAPDQIMEIIEFGICQYNINTKEIVKNESIYVKPLNSKVNEFCFNLTGITQELLNKKGISLVDAFNKLQLDYNISKHVWMSYGAFDIHKIQQECRDNNIQYPLNHRHINIKTLFALKYKLPKEVGMQKALNIAGLELIGKHHSGKDDAYNITQLLKLCLN